MSKNEKPKYFLGKIFKKIHIFLKGLKEIYKLNKLF